MHFQKFLLLCAFSNPATKFKHNNPSSFFLFLSPLPCLVILVQSERLRQVVEETKTCYNEIIESLGANVDMQDKRQAAAVNVHLEAVRRNKRCGVAYIHERARRIELARWEVGRVFPEEMGNRMSAAEKEYNGAYNNILEKYQNSIGLDLTTVSGVVGVESNALCMSLFFYLLSLGTDFCLCVVDGCSMYDFVHVWPPTGCKPTKRIDG